MRGKEREDLTNNDFGYIHVLEPAEDHITPSGQRIKMWLCECKLCGNQKIIAGAKLKSGNTKSCGCMRAYRGKQVRNKKICVVCGKEFECPPSDKTVTCSSECRRAYHQKLRVGNKLPEETKNLISQKAQGRDMSELQPIGTAAAMASPKSGRFLTNINAKDWHLISPDGKHYFFHSLNLWLRENGERLFGCKSDSREYNSVRSGLCNAKRAMLGGKYGSCTYKDWRVIPIDGVDYGQSMEDQI